MYGVAGRRLPEEGNDVKLSCDPSPANLQAGRCMVVLTTFNPGETILYLCRPGTDLEWEMMLILNMECCGLAFHQGRLYGVDITGRIILSATTATYPSIGMVYLLVQYPNSTTVEKYIVNRSNSYLVESEGDLLLVRQLDSNISCRPDDVRFEVFKLEEEEQLGEEEEFGVVKVVQVKDLGERMLFVGRGCSMSWSAQSQPHSEFFKKNCIYFFYHSDQSRQCSVGRFDLKEGVCNAVLPCNSDPHQACHTKAKPLWIAPPIV